MGSRLSLLLLPALACCGGGSGTPEPTAALAAPRAQITAMLAASADAWNRGDLEAFLSDYVDAPSTTFLGTSGVIRGVGEIRTRYQRAYWSSGRPEHALRFSGLEVRPLGENHAVTLGRYTLYDRASGETRATGFFTLVLSRTAAGWKIIHDHSSAAS